MRLGKWYNKTMKAEIITIGDEILLGQILDTNSRFAAAALARLGIETVRMESISDKAEVISTAVSRALQEADVVLVTGGLGPTKDDVTKKTLAQYFNTPLVFNERAYEWVKEVLSCYGRSSMNEYNKSQAMLPKDCTVLHNQKGTASGMWFERDGKVLVSLPGVPFEMEHLMANEVLPRLQKRLGGELVRYKMLTVFDVPEAELALSLRSFEEKLPASLTLAYLPSPGYVRLRLTGKVEEEFLASYWDSLKKALAGRRFTQASGEKPELDLVRQLAACGVTVASAESCTGGNIARLITSVPGASDYFLGSIVAYSNEVKKQVLGVHAADLEKYGAVSEAVALQMAAGARKVTGAEGAVATTGVAGPGGCSMQKPVGTVWIAVAGPDGAHAQEFHFASTRERNIAKASVKALELLVEQITRA